MKKTNDPDGPLHKWGEPEGVEDYKNKTPGQGKMKSFKEIQQESKDEVFTSLDHKINGKDHDTRMRDSWKNIHKIAGDLQREKEKKAREAEAKHNAEEANMNEGKTDKALMARVKGLKGKQGVMARFLASQGNTKELNKFLAKVEEGYGKKSMKEEGCPCCGGGECKCKSGCESCDCSGQIDELKGSTVKSYVSKATKDRNVNNAHGMDHLDRSQSSANFGDTKMSDSQFNKANKRFATADKRQSGIDRAKKRYNEDVEQVDELDTATLKSYSKKAGREADKHAVAGDRYSPGSTNKKYHDKKMDKRQRGQDRADQKVFDRENPVNEVKKPFSSDYVKKAASPHIVAFRNGEKATVMAHSKSEALKKARQQGEHKGKKVEYAAAAESVEQVDENRLLKVNTLSSVEYQRAKKLKGFDKSKYTWDSKQQLYIKEARQYKVPSNYAAMMAKKRKKAGTSEFGSHPDKKKDVKKEEVEQVDELSRKTLAGYIPKAARAAAASAVHVGANMGDNPQELKTAKRNLGKVQKREKGIATAAKKLSNEEVEQIDEIGDTPKGKKVLGAYVKKAAGSMAAKQSLAKTFKNDGYPHLKKMNRHSPNNIQFDKKGDRKKTDPKKFKAAKKDYEATNNLSKDFSSGADRRRQGIGRAVDRLTKEGFQGQRVSFTAEASVRGETGWTKTGDKPKQTSYKYDSGWKPASAQRKDERGNTIKNVAKHLAKKGLAKVSSEGLSPKQEKHLDVHDDGKIDHKDFAKLRKNKKNN